MTADSAQHPGAIRAKLEFPVWYRGFAKSYTAWANAPADLKTPLLLQGQALGKAEGWLLAAPERLSESEKRFIVRSITQRSREPVAAQAVVATGGRKRQSMWRRSSDRSLWHLYAVIAFGMWVFAPDLIKDAMERALNPGSSYDLLHTQAPPPSPPSRMAERPDAPDQAPTGEPSPVTAEETAPAAATTPPAEPAPDRPAEVAPPPAKAASRASRLASLAEQKLDAGQQRLALLIGIEATEEALAVEQSDAALAGRAASTLVRALVTSQSLGPLAARSATAPTTLFCEDAKGLLALAGDETIAIWRKDDSRRVATQPAALRTLEGAAIDRDCSRVALPNEEHNVELRTVAGTRSTLQLMGHEAAVLASSFGPGGLLLTAGQDGTARIWDTRTGRQKALLSGHDWHVVGAELSRDGRRALTASADMTARIWDVASGRMLHVLGGHQGVLTGARFIAGETRVLTTAWDGTARVWDAASGRQLIVLTQPANIMLAEATSDGQRVATADHAGGLQIWDAANGKAIGAIPGQGPGTAARTLQFSPDGRWLAVLSWNGTVAVHHGETGQLAMELSTVPGRIRAVALSGEGRSLVAIGEDGVRLTWPLLASAAEAITHAKAVAPPCLTADERATLGLEGEAPAWCADGRPRGAALP